MANIHLFSFNPFQEHTMVLEGKDKACVIVDPGWCNDEEKEQFHSLISSRGLVPEAILVTHCHVDHIWGARDAQDRYGIPLYMGPEDIAMFEEMDTVAERMGLQKPDYGFKVTRVQDGDTVSAAGFDFKVITTPGHSRGGVCYLEENEKVMFSGDTLFAGTIGRSDLLGGDYDQLILSIMEKLIWLDPAIRIFPGHGRSSTIGEERTQNPFLEPFNEKEELPDLG